MKRYDSPQSAGNGMTELTPSPNPTRTLIGIAFGTLFWNSISIILYKYQGDICDKESAIMLLGLFIVVNVVLFVAFCYFLVFYHIGRPTLKISSRCPRLGDNVALTWKLPDYRSITHLTIILEEFENVECTKCTSEDDSTPRKSVIASIKLMDTAEKREIKSGSIEFKIPGDAMHSFADYNCQIIWQLKLQAAKKWMDRRFEYTINVQPYEV